MTINRTFLATVVAWSVVAGALAFMVHAAGLRLDQLADIFRHLSPVPLAWTLASALAAAISLGSGLFDARTVAWSAAFGAAVFGVLGAAYVEASFRLGLWDATTPPPFAFYAIGHAEALSVLLVGLTGALIGLGGMRLRQRQAS